MKLAIVGLGRTITQFTRKEALDEGFTDETFHEVQPATFMFHYLSAIVRKYGPESVLVTSYCKNDSIKAGVERWLTHNKFYQNTGITREVELYTDKANRNRAVQQFLPTHILAHSADALVPVNKPLPDYLLMDASPDEVKDETLKWPRGKIWLMACWLDTGRMIMTGTPLRE